MKPPEIFQQLRREVIGQNAAVREVAVALYKHLIGHNTGNILMIGASGTGKTTIMRAMEHLLKEREEFHDYGTVARLNANLLADLASKGTQSSAVLEKLVQEAQIRFGENASHEKLTSAVAHGIVFVDEVDKIRSHVGDTPNVAGIVAQESFLTLMESEVQLVDIPVKRADGSFEIKKTPIDTGGILFIAGGAFEDLYDLVFDRVTGNGKNLPFKLVTKADGTFERRVVFQLGNSLVHQDLFEYGITPQFLARFDSIVTLKNLGAKDLITIFQDVPGAILPAAMDYFREYGVELQVTQEALHFIADKATENPRLGARALKEVWARIMRDYEFDPFKSEQTSEGPDGPRLVLDLAACQRIYEFDK